MTIEIAGFEIHEELGRGGFGVVYRARQLAFDRLAAVKVLLPRGPAEDLERTFAQECRAVGSLRAHPNVVTVYSTGVTADGSPYLAMRYLGGGSLSQRVPLRPEAVAALGMRLADGLGVAHAAGIVHRDVKPSNVLFDDEDEPVLVDFGISALTGETSTTARNVAVSIGYAPPEVLEGVRPSPAADVYALGATLFTAASGRIPYVSEDGHTSLAVLAARILTQPVEDLRPFGVPDALCAVIERCMAKDPEARYASTAEIRADLAGVAGNEVTVRTVGELWGENAPTWQPAAGDTLPAPAPRSRRRGRALAAAAAAALVTGVAFATAAASGDDRRDGSGAIAGSGTVPGPSVSRQQKGTAPGRSTPATPGRRATAPATSRPAGALAPPTVVAGPVVPPAVTVPGVVTTTARPPTARRNSAPRLAALPVVRTGETRSVSVRFTASDADGGQLRYSVSGLPPGLSRSGATVSGSIPASGVRLTARYTDVRTASYRVTVTVTDPRGASDSGSVTWTVRDDHLVMANYLNRNGCGTRCGEDGPDVAYLGPRRFSCTVDPTRESRIVRQSSPAGSVVAWGGYFAFTYAQKSC